MILVGLIVDELDFLRRALNQHGYTVQVCGSTDDLMELSESFEPHLAIVDLQGTGESRREVIPHIKESLPSGGFVPVLALYPVKLPSEIIRGFQHGADDFLARPFDVFELVLRLEVLWRIKCLQDDVLARNDQLQALAITDELTGLMKQREFRRRLEEELRRLPRFEVPVACMFFDCDNFKAINDTYGHAFGSYVLTEVARLVSSNLRDTDFVGRYGGDEFIVGLPGCGATQAVEAAERVRALIEGHVFTYADETARLTLSMGIAAATPSDPVEIDALMKRADQALYKAKSGGRNRVVCYGSGGN